MSVRAQHPEYSKYSRKWKRCRDVSDGQDAVHAAGVEYLPALKNQHPDDYEAYKNRTPFFNATWRTIAGLSGMLFRKPPKIEVPASVAPLLDTVTDDGQPLGIFCMETVEECLKLGRAGVLVDYPTVNSEGMTLADAQSLNLRPTMGMYRTEAIVNWKEKVVNNRRILSMVVLAEEHTEADDEFQNKVEERYRVLDLLDGVYRVRVFRFDEKTKQEILVSEYFPTMRNAPLNFIPFYFLSADDTSVCPDEPPLIDLVDLNLSHYRTAADYEHGCHFTGLPTGYICGHTLGEGEKIYLGSQTMLVFPSPDAKVGFLEFSGAGLQALEKNLERKESQMAILGARMLETQKKAQEAAETAAIHRSGENSLLASMASAISLGMRQALQTFSDWAGGNSEVVFELNKDFFPIPMDPQRLTALVATWQSGGISKETLFDNLKKGEIISDSRTFEDEETRIGDAMILGAPPLDTPTDKTTPTGDPVTEPVEKPESLSPEQTAHNEAMVVASDKQQATLDALVETLKNQPAPVINIPAPVINVPAPVINMPEQPAPVVNVAPAAINIAPPAITVNVPEQKGAPAATPIVVNTGSGAKVIDMVFDGDGKIIGANVSDTNSQ